MLFKNQQLKKCFVQLANKYCIPRDIIILLYNYKLKQEIEDYDNNRTFHNNMIIMQCLDSSGNLQWLSHNKDDGIFRLCPAYKQWLEKFYKYILDGVDLQKDNIKYLNSYKNDMTILDVINNSNLAVVTDNYEDHCWDTRGILIEQIKVFGSDNHLFELDITGKQIIDCTRWMRIKYLNTWNWKSTQLNYDEYKYASQFTRDMWQLVIHNSGAYSTKNYYDEEHGICDIIIGTQPT